MAVRSIEYFYDVMVAEKNSFTNLQTLQPNIDSAQNLSDGLKSNSRVARWRLIFWCVACCAYALDVVFHLASVLLESIVARSRYGTLSWYVAIAKEFQYGDALVRVNHEWVYSPVNTNNQVVQLAAAEDATGVVNLKVAKIVGTTTQPLAVAELNAFKGYIAQKKIPGVEVNVISDLPDELRLFLNVNINPLVLQANGELIGSPGVFPVEDAVNLYLKSLDFDGSFELMKLIDFVQQAQGVVSAYVSSALARYGANPFTAFAQRYYPNAGHMIIDPGTPLSGSVTYTNG